jgi:hypothetical protein
MLLDITVIPGIRRTVAREKTRLTTVQPPPRLEPPSPPAPPAIAPKVLFAIVGLVQLLIGIGSELVLNPVTPAIDAFGSLLVGFGVAVGAALLHAKRPLASIVIINGLAAVLFVQLLFQGMSLIGPCLAVATYSLTRALLILQSELQ